MATERFTNATGWPVGDITNILTAGPRGPALLQDIWLIEKMRDLFGAIESGNFPRWTLFIQVMTSFNPNSVGLWDNQPEFAELPMAINGDAKHFDHRLVDDHWEQPGNLFRQ
jgi:catalase